MRILPFLLASVVFGGSSAFASDVAIREQTPEEERALQMSSHIFAGEIARDYSEFFGKSLADIGIAQELVVQRERTPDSKSCVRPDDSAIRSAIAALVLQPFLPSTSHRDYREGRSVTGKLRDGRGFSLLFIDGAPIEASIEINSDTVVRFMLKKKLMEGGTDSSRAAPLSV